MQKKTLNKLYFLLNKKERIHVFYLLLLAIITAFFEILGIVSIMPFMAVVSNPEIIEKNLFLKNFFQIANNLGIEDYSEFLFSLGILVFILFIISIFFKALLTFLLIRFGHMREYSIGKRFIEGYLNQQYNWFLNRNSSELGKNILSEIKTIIDNGMRPMATLITQGIVVIVLIILLVFIDFKIALTTGLTVGVVYGLLYKFVRSLLKKTGKERFKANQLRFKSVLEAFGAIKVIKVANLENNYIKIFSTVSKMHAKYQSTAQTIGQLPRFIFEAVAFGGLLLLILYLMTKNNENFEKIFPILALYAFAGYRLMPAMQQIYASITQLRFIGPALDKIYNDLKSLQVSHYQNNESLVNFKKSIDLKNIDYIYPESSRTNLKNINISIKSNSTIGLVGPTGSGKTTTVDIILGLLDPKKGTLEVDGKKIDKNNKRAWQYLLGYVPQQIYLIDDTIAANIAFGVNKEDINYTRIEEVAKIANLNDFILNELPQKYLTYVGEQGVRLSGGQRQRIGIARALYHNPKVLVFDEATSALDNLTEHEVMRSLYKLKKEITIIIVAHRLNTIKICDQIFHLEKGEIKNKGSFEELKKKDKFFQTIEDISN